MSRMKRLSVVLAGILFVGCWSGVVVKAETTQAADDEVIELDFWNMQWGNDQYSSLEQELIEQYMQENPNIKIHYTSVSWDNWYQTFTTAIAAGSEPDVSGGGGYLAFQLYDEDVILPVDDLIEEMKYDGSIEEYYNDACEYVKYDGHYLALPWNFSLRVMAVNTDLLKQAGVEELPATWDEFYDACKAVVDNTDAYGFIIPNDNMGKQCVVSFMQNNNGGLFTEDLKNNVLAEENLQTVEFLTNLSKEGLLNPAGAGMTNAEAQKAFESGDVAFIYCTSTYPMSLENTYDWVDVAEPLASPNGHYGTHTGVNSLMVYNTTEHPKEAKDFALWWTRNCYRLFSEGGADGVPVWSFFSDEAFYQESRMYGKMIEKWLPTAKILGNKATYLFPELNEIDTDVRLLNMAQGITLGEDPETSLQSVSEAIDEAMDY